MRILSYFLHSDFVEIKQFGDGEKERAKTEHV